MLPNSKFTAYFDTYSAVYKATLHYTEKLNTEIFAVNGISNVLYADLLFKNFK
jgi:hypothetical protein